MGGETKVCARCGVEKPLDDFQRKRSDSEARRARCRACRRLEPNRMPTGRSRHHIGLDGNTPEELEEIRANYLVEYEHKVRDRDAMRARLDRGNTLESDDWVRDILGMGRVEVKRSRILESLPLPLPTFEEFDYIDDRLKLMES